jgi:hypothetical protein
MSHDDASLQSQLGTTVHGCVHALALEQLKHCDRPDTLANVPIGQHLIGPNRAGQNLPNELKHVMFPEKIAALGIGSWLVATVTGPPTVPLAPMVRPFKVMAAADNAGTVPDCNATTILDTPLAPHVAVAAPLTSTPDGVIPDAKNPAG